MSCDSVYIIPNLFDALGIKFFCLYSLTMEFHYSLTHNSHPDYEDDDVFYAEIRRQILLLTAEDDEDFLDKKHTNCSRTSKRRSNNLTNLSSALQPGRYFNSWELEKSSNSVPNWPVSLWRNGNSNINGNGTGVFIPHIVKTRCKPGKLVVSKIT